MCTAKRSIGAFSCIVRNLLESGAALDVPPNSTIIPDYFSLTLSTERGRFHCRTAWRQDRRIGVQFDQPGSF
jgi:hypothetical protein